MIKTTVRFNTFCSLSSQSDLMRANSVSSDKMRSRLSSSSPMAWKEGSSTEALALALRMLIDLRTYCWKREGRMGGAKRLMEQSAIDESRSVGWITNSWASAPNFKTCRVSSHRFADGLTLTNMAALP